jgi:hypothetical protein
MSGIAYKRVITALGEAGREIIERVDGVAIAQCPAHNDGRPSLSVRSIEGSVLLYCMAGCHTKDVVDALDLTMPDLFDEEQGTSYVYPGGRIVHRSPDKQFAQSGNKADKSLFHADRLTGDTPVYVTEGEKDVLAIESVGGQAVSAPGGAGNKPEKFDWSALAGREVRIVADRDEPGRKRAEAVAEHLAGVASTAVVYEPVAGKDAADHIAAGYELADLRPSTPTDVLTLSEAFDAWRDWRDSDTAEPIPTPWTPLNNALAGGLHPGRLYIVAARVGQGKSIAGQNIVSYAASKGHPSFVVSVEMPVVEVVSRMIAAEAGVDYRNITSREFSDDRTKIESYIQTARSVPLYVCDNPTVTIEQIGQKCRALKEGPGLSVLFLDYAQLVVPSDRKVSRQEQVAHIARESKLLAMELGIAVVLAAQLNRNAAEGEGRVPKVSDLRESGELEQSADVIMLMHHLDNEPSLIMNVAKNRTGPPKTISLMRRFDQARLDTY